MRLQGILNMLTKYLKLGMLQFLLVKNLSVNASKYIFCLIGYIFLLTLCIGETLVKKEEINSIYIEIIKKFKKKM